MIVHYAGMVCDMDEINKISEEYNIPVMVVSLVLAYMSIITIG